MNRNRSVPGGSAATGAAPQPQFRFNKVNTAPKTTAEQNGKRKSDNPPPTTQTTPTAPTALNNATNGEFKKLKVDESSNENWPNGQTLEFKKHLQILNDLTIFHKVKVKYDVVSESGPQHAKTFQVKCTIYKPEGEAELESYVASGSSISKAKQSAAELALSETKFEKPTAEQIKKKRSEFTQEKLDQTSVYNEANPKPLMSLNLDEKMVSVTSQVFKPKFEKKRSFADKKSVDPTHKKEIKPNSAAAAALAIANQSNKNPLPSSSASSPPVAPPAPVPVPPPITNPAATPSQPQAPAHFPAYPTYPGYPDAYTYQLYAQWQAQYYQQWQWAAMSQAVNGAKLSEPANSNQPVPQPPPPPPPAL